MSAWLRGSLAFLKAGARPTLSGPSSSSLPRAFPSLLAGPSSVSSRALSSSPLLSSWGGGKLKTHQGTAKRFRPISKRRPRVIGQELVLGPDGEIRGMVAVKGAVSRPGPLFKRGKTGKRHLNLQMNGSRLNSLGGTAVVGMGKGRMGWHLRRLMGNNVRD
ncbi:unnamed protein product [Parajaminaea phylloscopi]